MNTVEQYTLDAELFNYLSTAIIILDSDLNIADMNNSAELMVGLSSRQLAHIPLSNILKKPAEIIESIESASIQQHPFTEREREFDFITGRTITTDYTVGFMPDNRIVVELNQVDYHLRVSRDEINIAQSSAMHKLVKNLAHEVRNPLGGLRGAAQLLEKELDNQELKEYTQIIIDEADRLKELVSRILGDSKVTSERKEINIHEVLERVRQLCAVEAPDSVNFCDDYDPSIPLLNALSDQLIQAFLNIVRNALEAIAGSGTILFKTRIIRQAVIGNNRHKLVIKIDIRDDGPGIPEEIRESLFLPMVSSKANGTGLGLSISQSIIFQHKGIIECNEINGYTTFSVLLPLEGY